MMRAGLVVASAAFFFNCNFTSTRDLLDVNFTAVPSVFDLDNPGIIYSGASFTATVTARTQAGNVNTIFTDPLAWQTSGAGTISVVSESGFQRGVNAVKLRYTNASLALGQSEILTLTLRSAKNASLKLTSQPLVAYAATFTVTGPSAATPGGAAFTVTVAAAGAGGATNTEYNGTVKLTPENGVGAFTPATIALVNGTGSASVTYAGTRNQQFKIRASDTTTPSLYGISSAMCMGCSSITSASADYFLSLIAVPLGTTMRLSWNLIPDVGTTYTIYKQVAGNFVQQTVVSVVYWYDTGLTLSANYTYRVDAVKAGSVIATATVSQTAQACNTTVTATITTTQTWTTAGSPYCIAPAGATLSINAGGSVSVTAGTIVLVNPTKQIVVGSGSVGTFNVQGAAGNPVIISANTTADPTLPANAWKGIQYGTSATAAGFDASYNYTGGGTAIRYAVVEFTGHTAPLNMIDLLNGISDFEYDVFRHHVGGTGGLSSLIAANATATTCVVTNSVFNRSQSEFPPAGVFVNSTTALGAVIVRNNLFSANSTISTAVYGVGLGVFENATPSLIVNEISNNLFYRNTGASSAMALNLVSDMTITGNAFLSNSGTSYGGGVRCFDCRASTITNNYFEGNFTTGTGGGMYIEAPYNSNTISNNKFIANSAATGGALALGDTGSGGATLQLVQQNTFTDNSATVKGGAIYIFGNNSFYGNHTITRNYFYNNTATTTGSVIHETMTGASLANTYSGNFM